MVSYYLVFLYIYCYLNHAFYNTFFFGKFDPFRRTVDNNNWKEQLKETIGFPQYGIQIGISRLENKENCCIWMTANKINSFYNHIQL